MSASRSAGEVHRFLFVHVQKTAGTVFRQRLRNFLDERALFPSEVDEGDVHELVVSVDALCAGMAQRGHEVRVVLGHYPLCVTGLLEGPFTTITVLRDPVERTLSYLRHHRHSTPADATKSLEEIYDDPFRFHGFVHNHMVKMFSLIVAEMTAGMLTRVEFTPERLARAKAQLATVDVIGFQDRFQELCDDLDARYGWHLGDQPAFANRSTPVEASDELRRRIALDNADDIELYRFAQGLVAARSEAGADRHRPPPIARS